MTIDRAERLKKELTDKWVVVSAATPELRRFANTTGKVRTVNMNCRALVEFDGPVDIGWYDIDPSYLTIVEGPKPKKAAAHAEAKPAAKAAPAVAAPAVPAAGGGSPLDKIRAAAAAAGGAAKPSTAAPAAGGSPLDKIRAAAAKPAAAAAAPAAGGSPLDKIRAQAAAKPTAAATVTEAGAPSPVAAPKPVDPKPVDPKPVDPKPSVVTGGSPLDRIRAQGAAKKE